jgi:hypothetical protein
VYAGALQLHSLSRDCMRRLYRGSQGIGQGLAAWVKRSGSELLIATETQLTSPSKKKLAL